MVFAAYGVVPHVELVCHCNGVLNVEVGFAACELALLVGAAVDKLFGEFGADGVFGVLVQKGLELGELRGLLVERVSVSVFG